MTPPHGAPRTVTPHAEPSLAWAAQSTITDPGRHVHLLDDLPADFEGASECVRGLVSHYVASRIPFTPARRADADSRWVEDMIEAIVARDAAPLAEAREPAERFVGCCRDFTALTVAALRHHGIPARSRIGFADYFGDPFWYDHVVVEYFDGGTGRWVRADAQFPASFNGVDMRDLDASGQRFRTASEVWLDYRAGRIDDEQILDFGAGPNLPFAGAYFVRNYVLLELAHLAGVETLLWDTWGAMLLRPLRRDDDHALVDRVAAVLLDRDVPREKLEALLGESGLDPRGGVTISISPSGAFQQPVSLDRTTSVA